jgi:transcriptional regulator with XRE-family HTH domain
MGIEVIAVYERIRNMREDRDITQAQMAEHLNIHQTTYSDYELGNLNISIPVLVKLAEFYSTSIDYLINQTDEKQPYPRKK